MSNRSARHFEPGRLLVSYFYSQSKLDNEIDYVGLIVDSVSSDRQEVTYKVLLLSVHRAQENKKFKVGLVVDFFETYVLDDVERGYIKIV